MVFLYVAITIFFTSHITTHKYNISQKSSNTPRQTLDFGFGLLPSNIAEGLKII